MPRRAPPPFVGALVVIAIGLGSGSSGGSSGGSANNGANVGCSDGSSWFVTAVSMWSAGVSRVSLKLCWVAVDSLLDEDDDSSGLKPKPTRGVVHVSGF